MAARARPSHDDYTVGWICALPIEMAAAKLMLDEVHQDLPVSSTEHNAYTLGSIKDHNVVMACLPGVIMVLFLQAQLRCSCCPGFARSGSVSWSESVEEYPVILLIFDWEM